MSLWGGKMRMSWQGKEKIKYYMCKGPEVGMNLVLDTSDMNHLH